MASRRDLYVNGSAGDTLTTIHHESRSQKCSLSRKTGAYLRLSQSLGSRPPRPQAGCPDLCMGSAEDRTLHLLKPDMRGKGLTTTLVSNATMGPGLGI